MEDPEHNSPESLDNYLINKVLTQSRQQSSDCQYCGFNMPTSISLYYHSGERLRGVIYATVQDTLWFRGLRDQDFPPPHRTWGRHNDVVGVVGIDSGCSARLIRGLKLCLLCGKQRKTQRVHQRWTMKWHGGKRGVKHAEGRYRWLWVTSWKNWWLR